MILLSNAEIAAHLAETGLRYEMLGVAFKPQAYARAAESVAAFGPSLAEVYRERGEKGVREVPGVGPGIAAHVIALSRPAVSQNTSG